MAGAWWWRRAPAAARRVCRALWTWRTVAELALAGALCAYWQLTRTPWGLREQRLLRRFNAVGCSGDGAAAAAAAAAAVAREVVLFASGNRAMGSFLRNWGTSVERLGRGLSWWLVPLDQAGYDDLAGDASTQWPLLHDASGVGNFSAVRGAVRGDAYMRMAQFKWAAAAWLLRGGRDVVLSDPDVVLLRDPVAYVITLPVCDMYPTLDLAEAPASAAALAANGGYALDKYPNYYNSGFIYLRGTNSTVAFVTSFLQHIEDRWAAGEKSGDQNYLNNVLLHGFELQVPPGQATGFAIAGAIMAGRCLEYTRRGAPEDVLRVFPLNLALFPTHPVHVNQRAHEKVVERPFIVHYNWLETSRAKQQAMLAGGHWFLSPDAPLYEEEAKGEVDSGAAVG